MAADRSWSVELPQIAWTIVGSSDEAKAWFDWFQSYVVEGSDHGSTATISYLGENLQDEIARVDLEGLRPVSLEPGPPELNATTLQLKIAFSFEQIHFVPHL
jgi:hypothetical protein